VEHVSLATLVSMLSDDYLRGGGSRCCDQLQCSAATGYNQHMLDALTVAIYGLATVRLSGFIAKDALIHDERTALIDKINPAELESGWRHKLTYWVICMWCNSFLPALLITAPLSYWFHHHPAALIPALALAYSQLAGMLADVGRG
jgi:hypothetical protein